MVWIHYSKSQKPIKKLLDDSECIHQHTHWKPLGLWLSESTKWMSWMKSEMPEWVDDVKNIYKVSIKRKSNILTISSLKEMEEFTEKYGVNSYIDWKKVCKEYDGIIFKNYEKNRTEIFSIQDYEVLKKYIDKYYWYYAVDISSACIFRPSKVVSKFELIY